MIHTLIIDRLVSEEDAEERERLNRALAGTEVATTIPSGPLRYAKPGEIARTFRTVPVHEAMAALRQRMSKVQGVPGGG